jgi:hypothetical protein
MTHLAALAETGAFTRRHHRLVHRFPNQDKSIGVGAEAYRFERVRSLRVNPGSQAV